MILIYLKKFSNAFLELFFPVVCESCGIKLMENERIICTNCVLDIPKTDFNKNENNPVAQLFWGKTQVKMATALYKFEKGSKYQKLLHKLKYSNKPEIGEYLGFALGLSIKSSELFPEIDAIIPVPLHKKRYKKRGYNQSEEIAKGINKACNYEIENYLLLRNVATVTQTKMTKEERWANVSGKFILNKPEKYEDKNILLVDDVVTTGSTLEACILELEKIKNINIFVAVLAYA